AGGIVERQQVFDAGADSLLFVVGDDEDGNERFDRGAETRAGRELRTHRCQEWITDIDVSQQDCRRPEPPSCQASDAHANSPGGSPAAQGPFELPRYRLQVDGPQCRLVRSSRVTSAGAG